MLSIASVALLAGTAASQPGTDAPFVDVTDASNIDYKVGYTLPSLSGLFAWQLGTATNGGAASGDCDGDGDIDLFITYGNTSGQDGGGGPNRLYLNQLVEQGDGLKFRDIAEEAGVANTRLDGKGNDRHSGPTFADMDGDGDLDLFVGGIYEDPNKIFENDGDCHFTDVTSNSPEIEQMLAAHTVSASFGDYDLDGDLDMFLTHWGTLDELYGYPRELETDHLWRNESDESGIRYVNVSEETGLSDINFLTRLFRFAASATARTALVILRSRTSRSRAVSGESMTMPGRISSSPGTSARANWPSIWATAHSEHSTVRPCVTPSTVWGRRWATSTMTAISIGSSAAFSAPGTKVRYRVATGST